MADDHGSARFHQRLVAIHVEEVAEPRALHEHWIHDRIDVVRTDIWNADDQDVGLTLDRHRVLLKHARERLSMDTLGLAGPYARHPIGRGILMEHLPAQFVRHRSERPANALVPSAPPGGEPVSPLV